MSTLHEFDRFAGHYAGSDRLALLRHHTQRPAVLGGLGDIRGQSVLDVGCGDGVWSRMIKQAGARRVLGADSSPEMIRLAREAEARDPLGIEYHVQAAQQLAVLGAFHAVVAVFVLVFAETAPELREMCERIRANLVPWGWMVGIVTSFDDLEPFRGGPNYTKYGITFHVPPRLREGDRFGVEMHMETSFSFPSVHWSLDTYARELNASGFGDVTATPLAPSAQAVRILGEEHWRDMLDHPVWYLLRASAA